MEHAVTNIFVKFDMIFITKIFLKSNLNYVLPQGKLT